MTNTSRNWLFAFIAGVLVLIGGYTVVAKNEREPSSSMTVKSSDQAQRATNYVTVKYRPSQVDVANPRFEYLDTSSSSFKRGAWYDSSVNYMIINLSSTNYHYCGMSDSTWKEFKNATSFGTFYNSNIKSNFDCRKNPVPLYE